MIIYLCCYVAFRYSCHGALLRISMSAGGLTFGFRFFNVTGDQGQSGLLHLSVAVMMSFSYSGLGRKKRLVMISLYCSIRPSHQRLGLLQKDVEGHEGDLARRLSRCTDAGMRQRLRGILESQSSLRR